MSRCASHALPTRFHPRPRAPQRARRRVAPCIHTPRLLRASSQVRFHVHRIVDELDANREACLAYREPYVHHKHLWSKNVQATLEHFLEEATTEVEGDGEGTGMPSLEKFEARIKELQSEEAAIRAMEGTLTEGWLKIDAKPVRTVLSTISSKWVSAHTTFLKEHVEKSLTSLQEFIDSVRSGATRTRCARLPVRTRCSVRHHSRDGNARVLHRSRAGCRPSRSESSSTTIRTLSSRR